MHTPQELPNQPQANETPSTASQAASEQAPIQVTDLTQAALTRRRMLMGISAAAALGAGSRFVMAQEGQGQSTSSGSGSFNKGGPPTEAGPENMGIRDQNPDSFDPPPTDAGDVNSFKYPFAFGHNKVSAGGWARQVTVRDLPISTTLAGVNMRLKEGAIRELHWHATAEWAIMLSGRARVTCVDDVGRVGVDDVGEGDLWYFPSGFPHSIQALQGGCEFLLVFDNGAFSEFDTFLITDWMAHTPPEVLAKNFSTSEEAFKNVPKHELYIFNAPLPDSLESDRKAALGPEGPPPTPFIYRLTQQKPDVEHKGGSAKIVDSSKFKVSTTVAAALVTLKPGGLRELHWHVNADEWQYYIKGKGRMTVFVGGGKARTMDFQEGDVGYVDVAVPHYIENTGSDDLIFLEMFKSDTYTSISLAEWIAHLPPELVQDHLHLPEELLKSIPKQQMTVVPV